MSIKYIQIIKPSLRVSVILSSQTTALVLFSSSSRPMTVSDIWPWPDKSRAPWVEKCNTYSPVHRYVCNNPDVVSFRFPPCFHLARLEWIDKTRNGIPVCKCFFYCIRVKWASPVTTHPPDLGFTINRTDLIPLNSWTTLTALHDTNVWSKKR